MRCSRLTRWHSSQSIFLQYYQHLLPKLIIGFCYVQVFLRPVLVVVCLPLEEVEKRLTLSAVVKLKDVSLRRLQLSNIL